jgi:hypothetical protein
MPNEFLTIDIIDLFKQFQVEKLDDIPEVLSNLEKEEKLTLFPAAAEWLGEYYHRMKINIHREFIK